MIGAVFGDIIGSIYEWHNVKTEEFDLFPIGSKFTDDTVLSVAVANKILNQNYATINNKAVYAMWYKQYYKRYPNAGFGEMFSSWANSDGIQVQESESYEDAIRKAISIGGDSDTIACIAGGIAQAYYGSIPQEIYDRGIAKLDVGLRITLKEFEEKYNIKR
ncbi:ADP-ribosylglycohydrolase family protein [Anaerosporobacter sp.]